MVQRITYQCLLLKLRVRKVDTHLQWSRHIFPLVHLLTTDIGEEPEGSPPANSPPSFASKQRGGHSNFPEFLFNFRHVHCASTWKYGKRYWRWFLLLAVFSKYSCIFTMLFIVFNIGLNYLFFVITKRKPIRSCNFFYTGSSTVLNTCWNHNVYQFITV